MELHVSHAAAEAGTTARSVQRAIREGRLSPLRTVGAAFILDDIAVTAWNRSRGKGRMWTPHIRHAAWDLLSGQPVQGMTSSETSRLRKALKSMSIAQLAHASGGLGVWARYRSFTPVALPAAGPDSRTAGLLGVTPGGGWVRFAQVPSLDRLEEEHALVIDPDGDLGVVERPSADSRAAQDLMDTYLLGDARMSHLASEALRKSINDL